MPSTIAGKASGFSRIKCQDVLTGQIMGQVFSLDANA